MDRKNLYIIGGVAVLAAAAVLLRVFLGGDGKPPPSAPGYYTGPMKAKGGDTYGNDDGQLVPKPEGAKSAPPSKSGPATDEGK